MAGRRMRMTISEAEMRKHAEAHIRLFPAAEQESAAFTFMEHITTNKDFFYTTAQIRGAAEGLRRGMTGARA